MGKMKLSVKLMGAFLVLAVVILILGLAGWDGVSSSQRAMEKVSRTENMAKNLLQREIDHLNWAQKVGEFQRNESLAELAVEKDEHKCGFGKWYYGEDRKTMEAAIPEVKDLLSQIETPHKKLHQSAVELEKRL
jgi:methyl-accepting chemotaxis protein